ncbi:MAG: citrulline utilization hydrolase CtlX [Flavobacteriales bacterium]
MIRPATFRMNEQTAINNHYQQTATGLSRSDVLSQALAEFDGLVTILKENGVHVHIFEADEEQDTPDALFPNNWISFHQDGVVGLYPMFAENRRTERREDVIVDLEHRYGFNIQEVLDFTEFESHQKFLEGTGSIVLDRQHQRAYAAISPRTDRLAFEHFCEALNYEGIVFTARQTTSEGRSPIYHTNVMMSIGSTFSAICLSAIDDDDERNMVQESLAENGLEIIDLSENQINHFAGNMLEVLSDAGERLIVMSAQAEQSLTTEIKKRLSAHGRIISSPLETIETCGGGSARCMLAEIHLPINPTFAIIP